MKRREILFLLISIFILVVAWIGFNIYHSRVTSTISDPLSISISPISPDFNSKDIQALKNRKKIVPVFDTTTIATPSPTLSPTATPSSSLTPSPSPSITLTPTPTETTGEGVPTL